MTSERPAALVLLAEDDLSMREMLSAALRSSDVRVAEFADARDAISALERGVKGDARAPDLVITDVNMAGSESGLDVLHASRELDASVPVVVITAFGTPRLHRRARALGAARVVNKPFDLIAFRDDILGLLADTV